MAGKGNHLGPAVVYKITNTLNGKFYVGVTARSLEQRLREHVSVAVAGKSNGHFQRAIRKRGGGVFIIEPLHVCATLGDAKADEIRLIAEMKPHYNSTKGGDGQLGRSLSEEAKRRIGDVHRGNSYRRGQTHTDAVKSLLRELGHSSIATFQRYRHLGPEASSRSVICLDDGEVHPSASAAARRYGVARSALIELCLGKRGRKTVGGKRFAYHSPGEF